jgi:threonyl-tRNA synthetase
MLVVGDKEMEAGEVALRLRNGENPGPVALEEFIKNALNEIENKL